MSRRRSSYNPLESAKAALTLVQPFAAMVDAFLGLGSNPKTELTTRRIQLTETRIMREAAKEQREQAMFALKMAEMTNKLAQQENMIARQSLEIERLRKEMGLDAPGFSPVNYK